MPIPNSPTITPRSIRTPRLRLSKAIRSVSLDRGQTEYYRRASCIIPNQFAEFPLPTCESLQEAGQERFLDYAGRCSLHEGRKNRPVSLGMTVMRICGT